MPESRGERSTILRSQCHAQNSFADSRHKVCLVSDGRTRTPRSSSRSTSSPQAGRLASVLSAAALATMDVHFFSRESRVMRPHRPSTSSG